jgi:hypothetical protein
VFYNPTYSRLTASSLSNRASFNHTAAEDTSLIERDSNISEETASG